MISQSLCAPVSLFWKLKKQLILSKSLHSKILFLWFYLTLKNIWKEEKIIILILGSLVRKTFSRRLTNIDKLLEKLVLKFIWQLSYPILRHLSYCNLIPSLHFFLCVYIPLPHLYSELPEGWKVCYIFWISPKALHVAYIEQWISKVYSSDLILFREFELGLHT